jgi:hypothetical protein
MAARSPRSARQKRDGVAIEGDLKELATLRIAETPVADDIRRFTLTPVNRETVLFVSQQYHPQWAVHSAGRRLSTVVVNDFYLGAIVPPGVKDVEFQFRPFVTWSWMPQVLYGIGGLGLLVWRGRCEAN